MQQASRLRWNAPSPPGLKCCCAVASAVISGVVGQVSKCSNPSVIPEECSSVWLSGRSHTAQWGQLLRPVPPDGFPLAGEVTTLSLGGRQRNISPRICRQSLGLGLSSVTLLRLETPVMGTLCLQPASHDHIRHGLSWCGATVNIVPQFLSIEAFSWDSLMKPFWACNNLQSYLLMTSS